MRLSELHPSLSKEQRVALAKRCDISPAYLWQLATRWRGKKPGIDLLAKLADADARLKVADLVEEFSEPTREPEPVAALARKHLPPELIDARGAPALAAKPVAKAA